MLASDSVLVAEIAAVVKRLFERCGTFPLRVRRWKPGETVYQGFFLVKRPDEKIEVVWQHSNAINPKELADRNSFEYDNLDEAVSQPDFINYFSITPMIRDCL